MFYHRLTIVFVLLALFVVPVAAQETEYKIVGYFTAYSIYDGYFVTDIPANLLTHLNYAFLSITENGQCGFTDEWTDTQYEYPGDKSNERLRGNFKQLALLREANPDLKILMTIGGWENSARFSEVAATQDGRVRFVRSCIAFMRQYGFDGIDIDWRYPVVGGIAGTGEPADSENLNLLLADFRGQIDYWNERDSEEYLLTITVPSVDTLYENFQLEQIHLLVDWLNITTYGFHGDWSTVATHHAPLYGNTRDPRGEEMQQHFNVDAAVNAYLDAGVPAEKIVIGIPFYGQTWQIARLNDYFGLYEEVASVPGGTRPGGTLYYRDLIQLLNNPAYVRFFDEETRTPWLFNQSERIVISYEDVESITYKAQYVQQMHLGGVAVWELSFDDSDHTLLQGIYESLHD